MGVRVPWPDLITERGEEPHDSSMVQGEAKVTKQHLLILCSRVMRMSPQKSIMQRFLVPIALSVCRPDQAASVRASGPYPSVTSLDLISYRFLQKAYSQAFTGAWIPGSHFVKWCGLKLKHSVCCSYQCRHGS
jgi:hypothetical protein